MKITITLFLLFLNNYSHSQSFITYHNTCNSACELMSKGEYKIASDSLKKAIYSVNNPFAKDIFNLAKCFSQINEKDSCLYYLETSLKMMNLSYLLSHHKLWFEPLLGQDKWLELTSKNYLELQNIEKWQIDLVEKMQLMEQLDQHYRRILTDSIKVHFNDSSLINLYLDSIKYNDDIVQKELELIINKYGWPSRKITGHRKVSTGAILLHLSDSWFNKMESILFKEIEVGNLSPASYAMIADRIRLRNNLKPLYNSYSAFNYELTEEVIKNCRKIGCPLPIYRDCR